jgi:hypothetical protein
VDRSTDEVALNVMATAMVAGGVTVGAIQVTNKVTGDGMFDQRDRDLLEGLAAAGAVALRNAQLHAAGKRPATSRSCSTSAARSRRRWTSTGCSSRW